MYFFESDNKSYPVELNGVTISYKNDRFNFPEFVSALGEYTNLTNFFNGKYYSFDKVSFEVTPKWFTMTANAKDRQNSTIAVTPEDIKCKNFEGVCD